MIRAVLAAILLTSPALAQPAEDKPDAPKPGMAKAKDIVTEPLRDVRLADRKIPPELQAIVDAPYDLRPRTCAAIAGTVTELDGVLGADVDDPDAGGELNGTAKAALTAAEIGVDTLIPGRGLIRRVTGADKAERRYNNAVQAGVIRRAYLKGLGAARGCKPPAAPR